MITNIVLAVGCRAWSSWPVAPFFSGLGRVIRAKMHNRRGPSPSCRTIATWPSSLRAPSPKARTASFALRIMPPLFFAVAVYARDGSAASLRAQSPIPVFGDAITIMYSAGARPASSSPSAVWIRPTPTPAIGGVRELLMSVLIEPSMLHRAVRRRPRVRLHRHRHHGPAHHDGQRHRRAGRRDPRRHRLCDRLLHGARQAAVRPGRGRAGAPGGPARRALRPVARHGQACHGL